MTTENGSMMYMPVTPAYGNGDGIFGGNGMNGLWGLIILLAVLGYGNGGGLFGGGNGNNGGFAGAAVQRGFDQNAVITAIGNVHDAVASGNSAVQQALCSGFAGITSAISNGFAQAEIAANNRQMASMQQNFDILSKFQDCCCENRLATAGLQTAIAQDGALTRQSIAGGIQAIQDKLCQLELDGIKQNYENRIAGMQNALDQERSNNQALRFAASQGAQTAQILANNEAQTTALEQYLAPIPRPSYIVQNPNCCSNQFGHGGYGGYAA